MPKAPVDKQGQLILGEKEVWFSRQMIGMEFPTCHGRANQSHSQGYLGRIRMLPL